MNGFRLFYSPYYYADIGEGHVFPIKKFELVRDKLLKEGTLLIDEIFEPEPAAVEDVLLVHTEDYINRLIEGNSDIKRSSQIRFAVVKISRPPFFSGDFRHDQRGEIRSRIGHRVKSRRRNASFFSRSRRRFLRFK